jgi:hypothetical protein
MKRASQGGRSSSSLKLWASGVVRTDHVERVVALALALRTSARRKTSHARESADRERERRGARARLTRLERAARVGPRDTRRVCDTPGKMCRLATG